MKLKPAGFVVCVLGVVLLFFKPAALADGAGTLSGVTGGGALMAGHGGVEDHYAMTAEPEEDYRTAEEANPPVDYTHQTVPRHQRSNKTVSQHTGGTAEVSKVKTSDLIEAEVTEVLSANEIAVKMRGKHEVIKLAGVKDCPCDFNEQATKMAHAETKASKGFTVVDAGTIVKRCREIKDFLSDTAFDAVLIKLSGSRRDSSGRLAGVIWNKGQAKALNDIVQSYAHKQGVNEQKKHDRLYRKSKSKTR